MDGQDLKTARQTLGLSQHDMGLMLGYEDSKHLRGQIHKMESGDKPVRECQRRLVEAYLTGYRPADWPAKPTRSDGNGDT